MIVDSCFPGDDNDALKSVQHDQYMSLVPWMFEVCRQRYLEAIRTVGVRTELLERVRSWKSYNLRTLQGAHDWIAAHFRYEFDPAGQMPLPFDGVSYKDYLAREWCRYFPAEVRRLSEDGEFVRAVLTAVGYEDAEPGCKAERRLQEWLQEYYGPMDVRRIEALKD